MANEVSLVLKVSAEGMKGLVDQAAQFNNNMQAGAKAGGTAGSKAVSARSMSAAQENTNYNISRGIGGGSTGSATSDFARQASGLGGLVHLYATFAANMFAAQAAFTALSDAVNTQHLATGLDQLSAESGKSLGTLSKQLNQVTDGALSMKEAMTATANASAAGLSNSQILKIGEVAKKASQALGFDMVNAVERLTQGITKNRPQLLDELGIIVNINTVYSDYAKSVGKTANALTDYEKKQAFANAVLKQGLDKFSSIDIPTNPYTKLTSAMADMGQTALSLVNTVLTPFVRLLAESPTGLATAMGLVASVLLKQALPAIGAFKENANAAAEAAGKVAANKAQAVKDSLAAELALQVNQAKAKNDILRAQRDSEIAATKAHYDNLADIETDKAETAAKAVSALRDKSFKKGSATYKLLDPTRDPTTITDKELSTLDIQAKRFKAQGDDIKAATYIDASKAIGSWRDATIKAYSAVNEATTKHEESIVTENAAIEKQIAANNVLLESKKSNLTIEGRLQTEADRAAIDSMSRRITAQAAETASTKGFLAAIKESNTAIQLAKRGGAPTTEDPTASIPKMGALKGAWTSVTAGVTAATTAVSGFLSFAGPWIQVIGLVAAGLSLLDGWLSSNTKEIDAYKESVGTLNDSIKNVTNTLAALSKKSTLDQISISSITAISNAFDELSKNVEKTSDAYIQMRVNAGAYDSFKDTIATAFGGGQNKSMATELVNSITAATNLISDPKLTDKFKAQFKDILKIDNIDTKSITKALDNLNPKELTSTFEKLNKVFKDTSNTSISTAGSLNDFKTSLDATYKASVALSNSFELTDASGKYGVLLITLAQNLQATTDTTQKANAALEELYKDPSKLVIFGETYATQLLNIKSAFQDSLKAQKEYDDIQKNIINTTEALAVAQNNLIEVRRAAAASHERVSVSQSEEGQAVATLQDNLRSQKRIQRQTSAPDTQVAIDATKILQEGMVEAFTRGTQLIEKSLGYASEKAALAIDKAVLGLTGTNAIDFQAEISKKEISVQERLIASNVEQMLATAKLANIMQGIDLKSDIDKLTKETGKDNSEQIAKLKQALAINERQSEAYAGGAAGLAALQKSALGMNQGDSSSSANSRGAYRLQQTTGKVDMYAAMGTADTYSKLAKAKSDDAALKSQITIVNLQKAYNDEIAKAADLVDKQVTRVKARVSQDSELLSIATQMQGYTSEEQATAKVALDSESLALTQKGEVLTIEGKLSALRAENDVHKTKAVTDEITKTEEILRYTKETLHAGQTRVQDMKNFVALENNSLDTLKRRIDLEASHRSVLENKKSITTDIADANLAASVAAGTISEDKANSISIDIAKQKETDNYTASIASQDDQYKKLMKTRESLVKEALKSAGSEASIGEQMSAVATATADVDDKLSTLSDTMEKTGDTFKANMTKIDIGKPMLSSMKALQDGINNVADSLAGAFFDATQSGKFDFSQMVNSMIMDMVKLQFRMSMMTMFKDSGISGFLGGALGKLFGMTASTNSNGSLGGVDKGSTGPLSSFNETTPTVTTPEYVAKGGAYDMGIRAFAKGGMFTNSIVSSPTTFKFAKGTGLMGEAGPEAIMPLKRNANGVLGVANHEGGSGSNTQIVVNNYSGQQAQTKESVDSRGQRRVEVTIGNMVAGEITRAGSNAQQSIKNTFGQQPQLIRR